MSQIAAKCPFLVACFWGINQHFNESRLWTRALPPTSEPYFFLFSCLKSSRRNKNSIISLLKKKKRYRMVADWWRILLYNFTSIRWLFGSIYTSPIIGFHTLFTLLQYDTRRAPTRLDSKNKSFILLLRHTERLWTERTNWLGERITKWKIDNSNRRKNTHIFWEISFQHRP